MPDRLRVLTINAISATGLRLLPTEKFQVGPHVEAPDAILVRSQDLHRTPIPPSVKAIGRAGAGTNNIPVDQMSARGVPVFNAPGANANAVKELVVAGLLLASRHLAPALRFVDSLDAEGDTIDTAVESGKKHFSGIELTGRTLGIIGLGRIGCLVADAAIGLGMKVLGFDPDITVEAAWSLPSQVRRAHSVEEVFRNSEFLTLHVPLNDATRHLASAARLELLRHGAVLLNFSRDAVVDVEAVLAAIAAKRLGNYVCDFPDPRLRGNPAVVALPHLGASTREAEENCAVMVANQLREFLEHGNVRNSVNFPDVLMERESPFRVGIANSNVPNMLGQISTTMAQAGLNIHTMLNKSRRDMAYTLVDVDSPVGEPVLRSLAAIPGVLSVRYLPL